MLGQLDNVNDENPLVNQHEECTGLVLHIDEARLQFPSSRLVEIFCFLLPDSISDRGSSRRDQQGEKKEGW